MSGSVCEVQSCNIFGSIHFANSESMAHTVMVSENWTYRPCSEMLFFEDVCLANLMEALCCRQLLDYRREVQAVVL